MQRIEQHAVMPNSIVVVQDDLFGSTFKLCEKDFNSENHMYTVTVPEEVTLELYCPECTFTAPPPPPPAPAPTGVPGSDGGIGANATAGETELDKLLPTGECVTFPRHSSRSTPGILSDVNVHAMCCIVTRSTALWFCCE